MEKTRRRRMSAVTNMAANSDGGVVIKEVVSFFSIVYELCTI